jgi:hypothetical protein
MASTTPADAPAPDHAFGDALLAVELELMRIPSLARLNGARRNEISLGILKALSTRGVITGIPTLEPQPVLRAA